MLEGLTGSIHAGPTGVTSGEYGVFASVVSVVTDAGGGRVVRRRELAQESFARYAYFTDVEPSNISFGGGDQIFGPVHTNDRLKIYSSGATFHGPTTTSRTVSGAGYGTFVQGYTENVARIEMPPTAELDKLRTQAQAGGTAFIGSTSGSQKLTTNAMLKDPDSKPAIGCKMSFWRRRSINTLKGSEISRKAT